ncbi:MAG: twin-arginine translocase subunit TatC [Actinobacteria bacterium]|nr:twin-arginine translocase subunit TatC [Actinomycetota bacterium]
MALKEQEAEQPAAMPLTEHLRELRSRLVKSGIAIGIGMVIGWMYYDQLFTWLSAPFAGAVDQARAEGRQVTLALTGVADPFVLQIQIAAVAGLVLSAPVWLYQIWRFVTPGLRKNERRWAIGFAAVATPLFLAGVLLAYTVLPLGLSVLLGFTPDNVENIVSVDRYLSFFLRTILVFGIGFLVPLLLVLLNFAGVLPGRRLLSWWRWIIIVVLVFAAVATPTGDPINLMLLAGPIMLLVGVAVAVMLLNDRRRDRRRKSSGEDFSDLDDDVISPLDTAPSPVDEPPVDGTT